MSMLNPFATDAFNMVALTAAINKLANNFGRVEQLALMPPEGVRARTILIEEMSGVLNLLPTMPVGAPGQPGYRPGVVGQPVVVAHGPAESLGVGLGQVHQQLAGAQGA